MKKIWISVCAFIVGFSLFIPFAKAAQFTDVTTNNRFYDEILFLADEGIISGFPDGKFKPGQEVTRGRLPLLSGKPLSLMAPNAKQNLKT